MAAHRIDQLEVVLQLADAPLAQALMDRVAALRPTGLAPLLDRLCGAASPPGRLHRIDRLDLDLGTLPWDSLEDTLLQRLEPALRRALDGVLHDGPTALAEADAALEWLTCRARTGLLPWWAASSGDAEAPRHIGALRAGGGWLALLAALADDTVALRRLAQAGGAAAVALDDPPATAELQAAAGELAKRLTWPESGVAPAAGAVADTDPPGDPLSSNAPAVRAWRASLLMALADAARRGQPGLQPVLDAALRGLPPADRARLVRGVARPARHRDVAVALDRLATAGLGGLADDRIAARPAEAAAPAAEAVDAVDRAADAAGAVGGPPVPQPADGALPGDGLAPPAGPRAAASASAQGDVPADAPTRPQAGAAADVPEAPAPTPSARQVRQAQVARAALASLAQIDVPDAGLVLLWPFIVPLFQHAGLVTPDRAFVDDAARTRGVLLLAQLSGPDPAPAEPRLALAKLLCGLSPTAPFEPDTPPTEAEWAACADLLAAALAHAAGSVPAFARIDVAGFQALFVQRAGLLGARNGAWLLQVAQRAEDVLLDRLPWSWAWVRLPWMDDPLQVQW